MKFCESNLFKFILWRLILRGIWVKLFMWGMFDSNVKFKILRIYVVLCCLRF